MIPSTEKNKGGGGADGGRGGDGDAKLHCVLSLGMACSLNTLYASRKYYDDTSLQMAMQNVGEIKFPGSIVTEGGCPV